MLRTVMRKFHHAAKAISEFSISPESKNKLKTLGIESFFPIQANTFDHIISGKDIVAQANTGSGKTIAFALPIVELFQSNDLDRLSVIGRNPRVITLAPTRELAKQTANVYNSLISYGGLTVLPVYGGSPYHLQENVLSSGVDIVVGAPGRVKDLINRGSLKLNDVKFVVLDEVDKMLDMGFLQDVDDILKNVYNKVDVELERPQTLLFSATMPPWIYKTSKKFLSKENLEHIKLEGEDLTPVNIKHYALMASSHDRAKLISDLIAIYASNTEEVSRTIVFCERKVEADVLGQHPKLRNISDVLHGDIGQGIREKVLNRFRNGASKVLVTTDVAARGLDIPEVNLVIQCSPPKDTDSYIHRSGRTGRAGRKGISVCLYNNSTVEWLYKVQGETGVRFKSMKRPSQVDIAKARRMEIVENLKNTPAHKINLFTDLAAEIINEMGAERAIAAAFASMTGCNTKLPTSSLLTRRAEYTTMIYEYSSDSFQYKPDLFALIRSVCGPQFEKSIDYVTIVRGEQSMLFDIENSVLEEFLKLWSDQPKKSIAVLEEMSPEMKERTSPRGQESGRQRGFGGGNYSGYSNNSQYRRPAYNNSYGNKSNFRNESQRPKRHNNFGDNDGDSPAIRRRKSVSSFDRQFAKQNNADGFSDYI